MDLHRELHVAAYMTRKIGEAVKQTDVLVWFCLRSSMLVQKVCEGKAT